MFSIFSAPGRAQSGNVMVYVLLAIALFGVLTLTLSRQNEQSDSLSIDDDQRALYVMNILDYAASAEGVVTQMTIAGAEIDDLAFDPPGESDYDTNKINQIYHPQGGGLNYIPVADTAYFTGNTSNPAPGWYMGRFTNVEWTPSSSDDVILTAHGIDETICAGINRKLTGESTIPALSGSGNPADYLIDGADHGGSDLSLDKNVCEACEGRPALCVSNDEGDLWSFYSIIAGR